MAFPAFALPAWMFPSTVTLTYNAGTTDDAGGPALMPEGEPTTFKASVQRRDSTLTPAPSRDGNRVDYVVYAASDPGVTQDDTLAVAPEGLTLLANGPARREVAGTGSLWVVECREQAE